MKYFKDRFLTPAPEFFNRIKFKPVIPLVLPLGSKDLFKAPEKTVQLWNMEQISGSNNAYFAHLIPPANNRVNSKYKLSNFIGEGIVEPTLQTMVHCWPQDARSSLEHLIIGFHENHVLSLLAMPKVGNSLKLCQALSNTETIPNLEELNNPQLANQFSYQFAQKAGADPRPRASLIVRCDNEKEVDRVASFFTGIGRFTSLDATLIDLMNSIITQSKEHIKIAKAYDQLSRESEALVIPETIIGETYSKAIKDEIGRIKSDDSYADLIKQTDWLIPSTIVKSSQLKLFTGFPNGIPDIVKNTQNIVTYHPDTINVFPVVIPSLTQSILYNDYELFTSILTQTPLAIYERDARGQLPIEIAYQTRQFQMGIDLYNTWINLPRSQQWAVHIFYNTANHFNLLENFYGLSLDKTLKTKALRDYFAEEFPLVEHPQAVYKAIIENDETALALAVTLEKDKWINLRTLCVDGKLQEAKTYFAQFLPEKYAVFASHLQNDWQKLKSAIDDYFPDISNFDRAMSDGNEEEVARLRQEPVLCEWNDLQSAIDDASLVPKTRFKIKAVMNQINQLEDPIHGDRPQLMRLNEELKALHQEEQSLLNSYNKVRKNITHAQWRITEQNNGLKYLEWLKKQIRAATQNSTPKKALEVSQALINVEIGKLMTLLSVLRKNDVTRLRELFKNSNRQVADVYNHFKFIALQQNLDVDSLYQSIFEGQYIFEHFELYSFLINDNLEEAIKYIDDHLHKKGIVLDKLDSIESAKAYWASKTDRRPSLHEQVIRGDNLPIKEFVIEHNRFNAYTADIKKLFVEQCKLIDILFKSISVTELNFSFVKTISRSVIITHSLEILISVFMQKIAIDQQSLISIEKEFEIEFGLFQGKESEKDRLMEIWRAIFEIKRAGVGEIEVLTTAYGSMLGQGPTYIKQKSRLGLGPTLSHTSENSRLGLGPTWDDSPTSQPITNTQFQVFTLTLIDQQSSIAYEQVLGRKREQSLNLSLINLIKTVISQCPNEIDRRQFRAVEACSNVGGKKDLMLTSLIKSSLLHYESQDPWGYTPLLLAVINNRLDLVRAFFENDLVTDWVAPLADKDHRHYTLLSHARSREMTTLLLNYYTNPNSKFVFNEQSERILPVLLMYHHQLSVCVDTHYMNLLDVIAAGQPYEPDHLRVLLKHRDDFVQEGPYDSTMPVYVQQAFTEHNQALANRRNRLANRPKINSIIGFFKETGIRTGYVANIENKSEAFYSVLKKVDQLSEQEQDVLATLFAANFDYNDDTDGSPKCIAFFKNHVLTNKNYIFELFFQEQKQEPIGFFCFQVKLIDHKEYGRFLVTHLSLAACAPEFSDKGLLSAPFKIVLALKKFSDSLGLPLKCYARFARPGVAYLIFPKAGEPSPKYQYSKPYVDFIAGLFGNIIEQDGSSIPPVWSKAKINATNNKQLDEFVFLLDELLHANKKASLPYVVDVTDAYAQEWQAKLEESTGLTEQQTLKMYEQFKLWITVDTIPVESYGYNYSNVLHY